MGIQKNQKLFLGSLQISKLSREHVAQLDELISLEEIREAIKALKLDIEPGPD